MNLIGASCGCLSGTPENGWIEIRSTYCRAAERREFTTVVDNFRTILAYRQVRMVE